MKEKENIKDEYLISVKGNVRHRLSKKSEYHGWIDKYARTEQINDVEALIYIHQQKLNFCNTFEEKRYERTILKILRDGLRYRYVGDVYEIHQPVATGDSKGSIIIYDERNIPSFITTTFDAQETKIIYNGNEIKEREGEIDNISINVSGNLMDEYRIWKYYTSSNQQE